MKTVKYVVFLFVLVVMLGMEANVRVSADLGAVPGWKLVWKDEFNSTTLQPNPAKWRYHVGNGWNNGAMAFLGWGNNELEWYLPKYCTVQGGKLIIKATDKPPAIYGGQPRTYFSCRITNDTRYSMLYGAIEARMKIPNVNATWAAFWMLGDACDDTVTASYNPPKSRYDTMATNWPSCGEIDIMEHVNQEAEIIQNLFWDTRTGLFPWTPGFIADAATHVPVPDVSQWHVYRLEWTQTQLQWLVDGVVTKTIDTSPATLEEFRQPFHLIMNLAVGGNLPAMNPNPADYPTTMSVDYVRIYKFTT